MSIRQDDAHRKMHSRWRQIFDLGEQLISLGKKAYLDSSQTDPITAEQQALIAEAAARLLDAQARLWLPPHSWRTDAAHAPDPAEQAPGEALMRLAWEARQPYARLQDDRMLPLERGSGEPGQGCMALATPLISPDLGVLGVLQVARPVGAPAFDPEEIDLLDGLAIQALFAMQASQQTWRERWRLEQLSLVRRVSIQIADVRDLDELARRVTRLILDTFDYYYVAIFTLEPGWDTLHFRASAGPRASGERTPEARSPALLVRRGEGIIGSVAQSGEEILAGNVRQETRYQGQDSLPETRSEVALPLKIESQVLGVLDVQSDQLDDFDETDMLVLRALADNIAYAVEGARLYGDLHRRAAQLSMVQQVSQAITSVLDHGELLDEVVRLIQRHFGFPYVHLFTVHPGRRKVFYEAGSSAHSQALQEMRFAYDLDDPQGIIPWVARQGETVLANDVSQEPRYRPSTQLPDATRAELAVPLIFGGEVLGVLDVQSDQPEAFSQDDRFVFETLADNIAVALRNATLYRSESWRRQAADSLREVAGLLSADTDLEHVLSAILVELERTLPLDLAAIWLLDEGTLQDQGEEATLFLAAVRGQQVSDLELELGLRPEDVLAFNPPPGEILDAATADTWLLEALLASQPVIRSSQSLFEPLGACLDYPGDYSAIGAPLRVGARPLGVLTLAHHATGRYGSEARAMVAAFASYAAVAIENTRLYESAHEQAWVSTVLLQVAEATQAQTSLEELLETVIRITPTLGGVKACLLYLLDEAVGFAPAAASGLGPEQQAAFQSRRFAPGDLPALDRLVESGAPQILTGKGDDQPLMDLLYEGGFPNGTPLLVLVPLLAHGEVLGAFLVDYSAAGPASLGGALDLFFDERLAIIQGIAQQTALAVKNVQLLKSQKEEAYISVALLQVAQAVVSAGELEEILGSIVRITPILVGVQRSAIYLWDAGQAVFRLAQAYGLPRELQTPLFAPHEFPLLHAVIQRDQLIACPTSIFSTPGEEQVKDWPSAEVLEPAEVAVYLDTNTRLLLAFPLSVKGQVLGVLLVEEPQSADEPPGAGAYLRLREKRLEIITGISQQAALAIQNDRLQREMVERERMAREMQLARQIQRTFLPQELPDTPGWDLQMRWRTAREVGGDFYDFLELPNGRLGLVIADVADKGMPAALFMTLTRTLVRATAQDIQAPHEVLRRVNELIEPDAPQGMFVTLAYAVLDLAHGTLDYANAGHNPPLVLRSRERSLERLERSGMALGVIPDNLFQARRIVLEPGDYLVLYTDGVTEAFSPEGELYGEDRLCQTIEAAALWSITADEPGQVGALALLDAIDASVNEFIGEAPLSDDLSLVVVRRWI